jgi:hypothetical protein
LSGGRATRLDSLKVKPTDWYFFTQGEDAQIDIRSPTNRAIVDFDVYPFKALPNYWDEAWATYHRRCSVETLEQQGIRTIGAEYRGVALCNAAGLNGEKYAVAEKCFRQRVDGLYYELYSEEANRFVSYVGIGLLTWITALLAWIVGNWILAGKTAPLK